MTNKPKELYGRIWAVKISNGTTSYTWETLPIKFEASKTLDLNPNELKLSLFNLNPQSRAFLDGPGLKVQVKAGYRELNAEIFTGNLETIKDTRESGQFETILTAKDGAVHKRNLFMSVAIKKDTEIKTVIEKLLEKIIKEGVGRIQVKGLENATQGTKKTAAQRLADHDKKTSEILANQNKPKEKLTEEQRKARKLERQQKAQDKRAEQRAKIVQQVEAEKAASAPNFITVNVGRTKVLRGDCFKLLTDVCESNGLRAVVLSGAIHIVPKGTALNETIAILDETSGLIGIPDKTETGWVFQSLIRTDIDVGSIVRAAWADKKGDFLVRRIDYDGDTEEQPWYQKMEAIPADV